MAAVVQWGAQGMPCVAIAMLFLALTSCVVGCSGGNRKAPACPCMRTAEGGEENLPSLEMIASHLQELRSESPPSYDALLALLDYGYYFPVSFHRVPNHYLTQLRPDLEFVMAVNPTVGASGTAEGYSRIRGWMHIEEIAYIVHRLEAVKVREQGRQLPLWESYVGIQADVLLRLLSGQQPVERRYVNKQTEDTLESAR